MTQDEAARRQWLTERDLVELAASVFVAAFPVALATAQITVRNVQEALHRVAGLPAPTRAEPQTQRLTAMICKECILVWERGLLSFRCVVMNIQYVDLLRRGDVVRNQPDPVAATYAALNDPGLPRME